MEKEKHRVLYHYFNMLLKLEHRLRFSFIELSHWFTAYDEIHFVTSRCLSNPKDVCSWFSKKKNWKWIIMKFTTESTAVIFKVVVVMGVTLQPAMVKSLKTK